MLARLVGSPGGAIGLALVILVVLTAWLADTIAPGDPFDTSAGPALSPPSGDHVFGTDNLGRDMFTGVVHGAATSMTVVLWVAVLSSIIGITLGIVAGFLGGIFDDLIMRVAELFQVVPRFFLALLLVSFWGPGLDKLILLLGLTSWPFLARVTRAETIGLKGRDFVEAARGLGAPRPWILVRHILPNVAPPVIVVIALFASRIIMIEAGLAFLGLSDPDRISWGSMANNAQQFLRLGWWMSVFPGMAIVVAVLGLNLLADALNRALNRRR
jgi:peptide/nickel transport system permease protein